MSAVIALIGLMLLTWTMAVWASILPGRLSMDRKQSMDADVGVWVTPVT